MDLLSLRKKIFNYFDLNKLSMLHNGVDIIFCKTDYILTEFNNISKSNERVTLITGNSDYSIDEELIRKIPKNVIAWYAQNALANDFRLIPIPIGMETKLGPYRNNHGVCYHDRVTLKEQLISEAPTNKPSRLLYANFNISTNPAYRSFCKSVIQQCPHITYQDSNLTLNQYYNDVLDHEAVFCPIGNGVDTHRLWEALYIGRIPITHKVGNYNIYKLYEDLPIVILNSLNQLQDQRFLMQEIERVKNTNYNIDKVTINYWIKKILTTHYENI